MKTLLTTAAVLVALIAPAQAWTPEDCGPGLGAPASETKSLVRYCSALQRKLIADDPGSYILGRIEKAEPVQDDLNSKFYYWIVSFDPDAAGSSYFDSRSNLGKTILAICPINSVCALKIGIRKSWELNVSHATFWITKVSEVTRVGAMAKGIPHCLVDDPTGTPLNVRSSPNGAIIGAMKNGTDVEIVSRKGAWVRMVPLDANAGKIGWAYSAYVPCDE